jgi:hypothetical protein
MQLKAGVPAACSAGLLLFLKLVVGMGVGGNT